MTPFKLNNYIYPFTYRYIIIYNIISYKKKNKGTSYFLKIKNLQITMLHVNVILGTCNYIILSNNSFQLLPSHDTYHIVTYIGTLYTAMARQPLTDRRD